MGTRFIRVHGRIVPIKDGQSSGSAPKKAATRGKPLGLIAEVRTRNTTVGSRFAAGFKGVGKVGAFVGALAGGAMGLAQGGAAVGQHLGRLGGKMTAGRFALGSAATLGAGVLGAGVGALSAGLQWGLIGGGINAGFGARKQMSVRYGIAYKKK